MFHIDIPTKCEKMNRRKGIDGWISVEQVAEVDSSENDCCHG